MRYAILNSDKKVIDIRSEKPTSVDYIEVDEKQVQYIIDCINKDCFVFSTQSGLSSVKNIFKVKEKLKKKRKQDIIKTDKYMRPDFYNNYTQEEKDQLHQYRQELRDYPNKINTIEDVDTVPYPKEPDFLSRNNNVNNNNDTVTK